jgi:hypothetical protein
LVRNNLINQKVDSVNPDLMAQMCWLILIYTVHPSYKGIYKEYRVKGRNMPNLSFPDYNFSTTECISAKLHKLMDRTNEWTR